MKDTTFLTATVVAQDLSILVGLVIFAITPKAGRKVFLLLGLALLFSVLTDAVTIIGFFVFRMNMNSASAIGALFSTSSYFIFYKTQFKSQRIKSMIIGVLIIFFAFALINMFSIEGLNGMNSYTLAFRAVALIVMSLLYFYMLIKELPTESITRLPMFWINTAVLIYFSGTFFQYLLSDYLVNVLKGDIINTWTIKNLLGVLFYATVSIAFWLNRTLFLAKTQ